MEIVLTKGNADIRIHFGETSVLYRERKDSELKVRTCDISGSRRVQIYYKEKEGEENLLVDAPYKDVSIIKI